MSPAREVVVDPADCRGLAILVAAIHAGAAAAPWAAGCGPVVAATLSMVCLAALPGALRAVPGPAAAIRALRGVDGRWDVTLANGSEVVAEVLPATRVLAGFVFCQVRVAGQKLDWWLPAYAVPATAFRRLKVALRCGPGGAQPDLLDSPHSRNREAARRNVLSPSAN